MMGCKTDEHIFADLVDGHWECECGAQWAFRIKHIEFTDPTTARRFRHHLLERGWTSDREMWSIPKDVLDDIYADWLKCGGAT